MSLPKPVLPDDIITREYYGSSPSASPSASEIWRTWAKDPTKVAVLRAILSCRASRLFSPFLSDVAAALVQNTVCSSVLFIGLEGSALLRYFQKRHRIVDYLHTLILYANVWKLPATGNSKHT